MKKISRIKNRVQWPLAVTFVLGLVQVFSPEKSCATDIQWNGFGSGYYGQAFNKGLMSRGFQDNNVDFTNFSLMGLNVSGTLTDEIGFAGQLLAQGVPTAGTEGFNLSAQWAFLNYHPNDAVLFKVGRQLYPLFIASEYVSVGYLLPYRAIPPITFNLSPYNSIDGVSVGYAMDTPVGSLNAEVFGGSPVIVLPSFVSATFSNLFGVSFTLTGKSYQLHLAATGQFDQGSGGSGNSAYSYGGHVQHYSLGYRTEQSNFVSWGEYAFLYTPDGSIVPPNNSTFSSGKVGGKYLGFGQSGYVLVGYRMGKFLPRYTFSEGNFLGGVVNGADISHTLGVNYQFRTQAVVKVEYEFDQVPAGRNAYTNTQSTTNPSNFGNAFYAGVDFIF